MYTSLTPRELYNRAEELKDYRLCYVESTRKYTPDYDLVTKTLTLYFTPDDFCYGIEVSVQDINSGAVAWLYSPVDNKQCNGIAIHTGENPGSVTDKIGLILNK